MYESTAGAAQCIGRPDNQWKSDLLCCFLSFKKGVGNFGCRHTYADFNHQLAEFLPVFGFFDGCNVHTDYLYLIFFPKPPLRSLDTEVKCRLPTHGREYGVDTLFLQDLLDALAGER